MRRLGRGFLISALIHAGLFASALGVIAWKDAHAERSMTIDLVGSSLLLRPKNDGSQPRHAAPPQPWIMALKGHYAPPPKAEPVSATPQVEEAGPPCPAPCPDNPGDWLPAAAASRKAAWTDNVLTEDDYPPELRSRGVEGKVVVEVLVDATGALKKATLIEGSDQAFSDLVMNRLKESKFRPAYDQEGNAVASRLRLNLGFSLRH